MYLTLFNTSQQQQRSFFNIESSYPQGCEGFLPLKVADSRPLKKTPKQRESLFTRADFELCFEWPRRGFWYLLSAESALWYKYTMGIILNKEQYRRYLLSPYWRRTRQKVFREQGKICFRCGKHCDRPQIHHESYEFLCHDYNHTDFLKVCCRNCHRAIHRLHWWQNLWRWITT